MERKWFPFKLDDVADVGTFTGHASVAKNVDLGNDKVMAGAFTKTLKENPEVPVLWQHVPGDVVGTGEPREDSKGLAVKGTLVLEVQRAKEAHALMKARAVKGLSIGYDVIKQTFEKNVRLLHELKLYEFSIVTFPMNPLAQVNAVKRLAEHGNKFAATFEAMNAEAQLRSAKYTMVDVLMRVLDECVFGPYDGTKPSDEEVAAYLGNSLDEFKSSVMLWADEYRKALYAEPEKAAQFLLAVKEGRVLSSRNTQRVRSISELVAALLADAEANTEPDPLHSDSDEAATPDNSDEAGKTLDVLIRQLKTATT